MRPCLPESPAMLMSGLWKRARSSLLRSLRFLCVKRGRGEGDGEERDGGERDGSEGDGGERDRGVRDGGEVGHW